VVNSIAIKNSMVKDIVICNPLLKTSCLSEKIKDLDQYTILPIMSGSKQYDRIKLFEEMEKEFENKNEQYFKELLDHHDNVVRTRAVCILAGIGVENAIEPISKVLKYDKNALVRHEAAFSLGQLGYRSGVPALAYAVKSDSSFFVRHEAAVALGVIGSEEARRTLSEALKDESEEVRESAVVALANLDYIKATNRADTLFSKMTGG
jgi:HEAT repeat protein